MEEACRKDKINVALLAICLALLRMWEINCVASFLGGVDEFGCVENSLFPR